MAAGRGPRRGEAGRQRAKPPVIFAGGAAKVQFGVAPRQWAPADAGGSGGLLLSCRPGSFGPAAAQALPVLAELGVRAVEIGLPEPARAAEVRAQLERHGLHAASVQVDLDLADPEIEGRAAELAQRAVDGFGARILFVSVKTNGRPKPECYAALRRVGDGVARAGATVVLETHPDLVTCGTVAAETMRGVDHPHVRVNWDPANLEYYNHAPDGRAEFDRVLPWVGAIHLKDTTGGFERWAFCTLGQGVVDFPHILGRLRAQGFSGPCTMEIEGVQGERLSPQDHIQRVRDSVAYLRSLGYFAA